jgi:hypothetical protein
MRTCPRALWFGRVVAVTALASGCLNVYRPATVLVCEAGTRQPARNVEVGVRYHSKLDPLSPFAWSGRTDTGGMVTLPVSTYSYGQHFYARYDPGSNTGLEFLEVPGDRIRALPLARWLWPWARPEPDFVIEVPGLKAAGP